MTKTMKVKAECLACGATGIYCGFAEAKGEGVVCLDCGGTGCQVISYKPFTKRRRKKGVKVVRRSRGSFIVTGIGGTGDAVAYEEFLAGKMPPG
jgi:hypothetical protein